MFTDVPEVLVAWVTRAICNDDDNDDDGGGNSSLQGAATHACHPDNLKSHSMGLQNVEM
jgi:hypothetical protein